MVIKNRKGFIYTLEAVIASLLILGVAVTVLPGFQEQQTNNDNTEQQVFSGLKTLDRTGNLAEKSAPETHLALASYVPEGYTYSVDFVEVERVENHVSAPYEEYVSEDGNNSELQLWIDSASNLDVTFNGQNMVEDYSGSGYEQFSLTGTEGWLNFTGSANIEYSFDIYKTTGQDIDAERVSVANYMVLENELKEIRVRMWK